MNSITDKPISSISEDLLKIDRYSQALSNFIIQSDTPITIGLQGEWGTGKTSLMGVLKEVLDAKNIATSWVNTWEYSMFMGSNETTPRVLNGMLQKLEEQCKAAGHWDIGDEASQRVRKVGRFLGNVANQLVAKKTGVNIKNAADTPPELDAEITAIKNEISLIIEKLIQSPNNPYDKVVFFVDDLDRINPADAVEVLEALKNVFDISNCIFILAIDYDVVVKGLENKFGPKTEANEREFRSFFDKIIQVPFSMPVGVYDITHFLVQKLQQVGLQLDTETADKYAKVIRHTVGSNPRSLKRYLNSFSLINNVRAIESDEESAGDDFMLFSLLGLQISYPQIFRLIAREPDYCAWSRSFASKLGVNLDDLKEKIAMFGEDKLIDEDWEQMIWAICQKEAYLKARTFEILQLLNLLRDHFGDSLTDEIETAMGFASITNVDDDPDAKQSTQATGKRVKYDSIEGKRLQLTEAGLPEESIKSYMDFFSILDQAVQACDYLTLSLARTGASFNDARMPRGKKQLFYVSNPQKRSAGFPLHITANTKKMDDVLAPLKDKYTIQDSPNVKKNKTTVFLAAGLIQEMGQTAYREFLHSVADLVIEHRKTIKA